MTTRANVTSVDAIKSFRATLVLYASKARPTLEEVSGEIVRTRVWLENEQRVHWEGEVRRRTRKLEDAQQALFSSKMSQLREASAAEQMAVTRAKKALDEADGKLRTVKHWHREFDNRTNPLARPLERMHTILAHDVPLAIAHLTQVVETLEAYANVSAPIAGMDAPAAPAPSGNPSPAEPADKSHTGGNS